MGGSVLVIGGGLAGLSTALHLGDRAVVLEATASVGGLCRSYRRGDYLFDVSGHLLHFRQPAIRRLVGSLLPRRLVRHRRRAFIRFGNRLVDYPFQAHLHQLPEAARRECLEGFLQAGDRRSWGGQLPPADFESWCRHYFGRGISRHFLEPYNAKLWQVPLAELTVEWAEWAVPVPTEEQVRRAAEGGRDDVFGYNPVFFYPRERGIGDLAVAMAERVVHLHLGEKVVEVDLGRRRVVTGSGRKFYFEHLVSTMPLPLLLRACKGLPAPVAEAGERLRCVPVCVFNVGLSRPGTAVAHWIYFPERRYPFYRVGFSHNFFPSGTPEGCQSLYVEVSRPPGPARGCRPLWEEVNEGLVRAGIMMRGEKPAVLDVLQIPHAYVIYDSYRASVLPHIHRELERNRVLSIGRYGAWEYSTMEDAISQGKEAAGRLRRRL